MKHRYRNALPQLEGELFLTDAGMETDLIFNRDVELREFAAHTALESDAGRHAAGRLLPRLPGRSRAPTARASSSTARRGRRTRTGRTISGRR